MTPEELLKPRYKVIADYPGNNCFKVGEVFTSTYGNIYADPNSEKFSDFPHLFQPLQWWEERKPEDMPEYLKQGNRVYKVYTPITINDEWLWVDGLARELPIGHLLPATLEEYTTYVNSLKPQP